MFQYFDKSKDNKNFDNNNRSICFFTNKKATRGANFLCTKEVEIILSFY